MRSYAPNNLESDKYCLGCKYPLVANADAAYNQFKKTQIKEFKGDKAPENVELKNLK